MAPLTTPERLAVLESLSTTIQRDVSEIKDDVKALARAQTTLATDLATKTATIATELAAKTATLATNLAVRQSSDSAISGARASNGVWVRAIVPWFIAGIGAGVGLLHLLGVF